MNAVTSAMVALEGQHVERERQARARLLVPRVQAERGWPLACAGRGASARRPTAARRDQELRDASRGYQVASGGIDQAASSASIATTASMSPLPGVHVVVDELAEPLVAERAQRRLLALVGHRSSTLRARCRALLTDAPWCRATRRPPRGEAQHLAQDQHRALVGGQVLERGDERQLDALASGAA